MNPPKFMLETRQLEIRSITKAMVSLLLGGILDDLSGKKTNHTEIGMIPIILECQIYIAKLEKEGVDLYSDFWGGL